jgi:hypothetical protein
VDHGWKIELRRAGELLLEGTQLLMMRRTVRVVVIETDFTPRGDIRPVVAYKAAEFVRRFGRPLPYAVGVNTDNGLNIEVLAGKLQCKAAACSVVTDHKQPRYARQAGAFDNFVSVQVELGVIKVTMTVC